MSELATLDDYGVLIEPATLKIQRLLPGPIERVWAYLTESELRRQWLSSGAMQMEVGSSFEMVWRNDELTEPPGQRPEGSQPEHRMTSQILELEPLRRLSIAWGSTGGVTFELEPQGGEVLLTVTHKRVPDRAMLLSVSSGWHAHLGVLDAKLRGTRAAPFWEEVRRLKADYESRIPA